MASLAGGGGARQPQVSDEEWKQRLEEVTVDKALLNRLVMNFLVVEGYKDAAEQFEHETGTPCGVNLDDVQSRMLVREAVHRGDIDAAIDRVNDLDPEILDQDGGLVFRLKQQQFIELLRAGKLEEALQFAQVDLAGLIDGDNDRLAELEKTMALLAFEQPSESPVGDLFREAHRLQVASELNGALLAAQRQDQESKLPTVLKMLLWAQQRLAEKVSFPAVVNVATGERRSTATSAAAAAGASSSTSSAAGAAGGSS